MLVDVPMYNSSCHLQTFQDEEASHTQRRQLSETNGNKKAPDVARIGHGPKEMTVLGGFMRNAFVLRAFQIQSCIFSIFLIIFTNCKSSLSGNIKYKMSNS